MQLNNIDHVGIRVADFDRAVRFYETLGFAVIREDANERVITVKHPCGITLNFLDSANNNHDNQNVLMDIENKYPGYTHYAININSAKEAVTFLEANNITITEGPVTFGNGKTSLFIRDPDRNVIEFTQDPKA
ncbi:VOC family protein [Pseudomonadota bacterium]